MLCVMNRILVGLPSVENREMILKTILAKEKVEEGLDYKEIATMTEGYSGSDLKVSIILFFFVFFVFCFLTAKLGVADHYISAIQNLCTTAAYRPVRELIQQERLKDLVSVSILNYTCFSCFFLY